MLFWATTATAENLKLTHTVYLGGLYLGSIETDIEQTDQSYVIRSDALTNKRMSWMLKWTAQAMSQGHATSGQIKPELHAYVSQWRDKKSGADIRYDEAGKVDYDLVGKKRENASKYTPLDPGSLDGSLDPLSMVLSAVVQFERDGTCSGTYPVFDGRRRYDVTLQDAGVRQFKSSTYSVFAGEARGCQFEVIPKGGFRQEKTYEIEDPSDLVVWVAAPIPGARPVPVRMQVNTPFGFAELHLDQYHFGDTRLASRNSQ